MEVAALMCVAFASLNLQYDDQRLERACNHMPEIIAETKGTKIKPEILLSLIHYESRWKPKVVSKAGACGLTQVIPRYSGGRKDGAPKLSCQQLQNPKTSIKYGARILHRWINKYGKGSVDKGLCGYNAGYNCKGTSSYSRKVRRLASKIRRKMKKIRLREQIQHE